MKLSARNQLPGKIKRIKLGTIMAEVAIDVAGTEVVAEISRGSAIRLGLEKGDAVTAIIKSTEVILGK